MRNTTLNGRQAAVRDHRGIGKHQRLDATVIVVGLPSATYAWTLVTPAGSLSRRMAYPTLQREGFLTLNGLAATAPLTLGSLVKLVVTG